MTDELRFKDFSLSPEPVVMRIVPDDFRLYPEIPLDAMMEVAKLSQTEGDATTRMGQLLELIGGVMFPEDFDTFVKRTHKGTKEEPNPNPIGMRHITAMLPWMLEVYGLRPTQESSESSDGSGADDTSSMELASDEALTS